MREDHKPATASSPLRVLCATFLAFVALLSGCSSIPSVEQRTLLARSMATAVSFTEREIATPLFTLRAFSRAPSDGASAIRIFIEGDGLAYASRATPSLNPTPTDPVALRLASADRADAVVYLARPCQYQPSVGLCRNHYWWTQGRLSAPVIASLSSAIDAVKNDLGAEQIELVGYSGGGALAVLLAAQRTDVRLLVTVAGLIDTARWLSHHKLSPLDIEKNPAALIDQIADIPQWHFVGADDQVIPPAIALRWTAAASNYPTIHVVEVPDTTHHCCWTDVWRSWGL